MNRLTFAEQLVRDRIRAERRLFWRLLLLNAAAWAWLLFLFLRG